MQDEEGFDNNQKVQLVDFNYRPLSLQQEVKRNNLITPKARQSWHEFDKYLEFNDDLRQEYTQIIISKQLQNIVFNKFNNEVGLQEHQISFEADFQSSNLEIAIKRKYLDYQLYMRPDTNTNGYFQWFYFKVKCARPKKVVSFTIRNFVKGSMLYSQGLTPFYKSSKDVDKNFQQMGSEVKYYENASEGFYCLKFSYEFTVEGQEVEFSSQPPYTFTKMIEGIRKAKGKIFPLCKSQLGKKVPYIIFNNEKDPKAIVFAIARQHPGESIGSWMMDGFLTKINEGLFDSILWVVVPMLNVDGVITGNNRTGISGYDYNRYWNLDEIQKKEKSLPEIAAFLNLLKTIKKKYPKSIKMFLDFHGHSSQPNIFSYGPPFEEGCQNYFLSKCFPELISKRNEYFSLQQCSYTIKLDKKNTARNLMHSFFGIPFTYTIEGSFGILRNKKGVPQDFVKVGEDIAISANQFLLNYVLREKNTQFNLMMGYIKDKYRQKKDEGQQYDSDSQISPSKQITKKKQVSAHSSKPQIQQRTYKVQRSRINTDVYSASRKDSESTNNSFQLFKIQQTSPQKRYMRFPQNKRNETEITICKGQKTSFLPKLKEAFTSRQRIKSIAQGHKQVDNSNTGPETSPLMNMKELQKHLFRLRNSKVGKKILIINAYGV